MKVIPSSIEQDAKGAVWGSDLREFSGSTEWLPNPDHRGLQGASQV